MACYSTVWWSHQGRNGRKWVILAFLLINIPLITLPFIFFSEFKRMSDAIARLSERTGKPPMQYSLCQWGRVSDIRSIQSFLNSCVILGATLAMGKEAWPDLEGGLSLFFVVGAIYDSMNRLPTILTLHGAVSPIFWISAYINHSWGKTLTNKLLFISGIRFSLGRMIITVTVIWIWFVSICLFQGVETDDIWVPQLEV